MSRLGPLIAVVIVTILLVHLGVRSSPGFASWLLAGSVWLPAPLPNNLWASEVFLGILVGLSFSLFLRFPSPNRIRRTRVQFTHDRFLQDPRPVRLASRLGLQPAKTGSFLHGRAMVMPALHPDKYAVRKSVARGLSRTGSILHLYAGRGNLLKSVYRNRASQHILVDRDLGSPRLGVTLVKHEQTMNKFLNQQLPQLPKPVKLVDIDPFGSPGHDIQKFFANYPYRESSTDGRYRWLCTAPGLL